MVVCRLKCDKQILKLYFGLHASFFFHYCYCYCYCCCHYYYGDYLNLGYDDYDSGVGQILNCHLSLYGRKMMVAGYAVAYGLVVGTVDGAACRLNGYDMEQVDAAADKEEKTLDDGA